MTFYFCYFGNLGLVHIATVLAASDKNEVT